MWWFCTYKLKVKGQIRQYKTTPKSHNSHVVIADMLGGDDDAAAAKAKINFVSWTMFGVQGNFKTQGVNDATNKGLDLDSVTVGAKSYNKFVGNFLPNCPVYIEIALAETEMEDYAGNKAKSLNYIYQKNDYGIESVEFADGIRNFISGMLSNPVAYLANSNNNSDKNNPSFGSLPGPGSNPFLGHLKFGFNTPYINYLTGFNYAKPDVRQAITWTTICSSWDAGYHHVGGFNQFSLGSKAAAALEEVTGLVWDIGFAPNKTADRKGTKFGYWGWAGVKNDSFAVNFQTNGMYNDEYMFSDPVEHDFILGAKMDSIEVGDGRLRWALEALLATHQKDTKEICDINLKDNPDAGNMVDYFGYSTDVWYRTKEFKGLENLAANVQVGYKADLFNIDLEYRLRGMQASMLYLRENHDDGTFDLSNTLGLLNSQRVALNAWVKPVDGLQIDLGVTAEMPLTEIKGTDEACTIYENQLPDWWYNRRFLDEDAPIFNRKGGAEFTFKPAVSYTFEDLGLTVGAYGDMNLMAYSWSYGTDEDNNKYSQTDSPFRLKKAGASVAFKLDNDIVKDVNIFYGFDMSDSVAMRRPDDAGNTKAIDIFNSARIFNTLIGQVNFAGDITANIALGLKTKNGFSTTEEKFDEKLNNPFAFAIGASKRFKAMKKPTVYAQFVYNMDPFKHFGDGQDQLNLDRANVKGSVEKEGAGNIDAVNWYDGRAAVRVGVRWDI